MTTQTYPTLVDPQLTSAERRFIHMMLKDGIINEDDSYDQEREDAIEAEAIDFASEWAGEPVDRDRLDGILVGMATTIVARMEASDG
jgi:hypothetical protein